MTNPARDFYRSLDTETRLLDQSPDDPRYVPILQSHPERDPIRTLAQNILFEDSESVNLLTGFRGNGKSTELRRLKWLLEQQGCVVALIDMANYMLFTEPVELSDFLLSLMLGLTESVRQQQDLDTLASGYTDRLAKFLTSEVKFQFKADLAGQELGIGLKNDPSFKQDLQKALRGHYGSVTRQAHEYVAQIVTELRRQHNDPDLKLVLLVDSLEQIRGIGQSEDAHRLHDSMVELFYGQTANLKFPLLHLVYTLPPFLRPLMPGMGRAFGSSLVSWPNLHVRCKDGSDDPTGLALLQEIVDRRFADWQRFFSLEQLHTLGRATGGDLRDFFRVLREALIASSVGEGRVTDAIVEMVIGRLRRELLPIAIDDARWLHRVHASKGVELQSNQTLSVLARFFDNNLIMNYLNGEDWYDVHPLLIDEVRKHAPASDA